MNSSGEGTVRFSNAELKKYELIGNRAIAWIGLTGTVVEALTGISREATASVALYKDNYKLEITKSSDMYKPGLEYNLLVSNNIRFRGTRNLLEPNRISKNHICQSFKVFIQLNFVTTIFKSNEKLAEKQI